MEKAALACPNSGQAAAGRHCAPCGQKTTTHRCCRHFIAHDLIHGIWPVDNGVLFTLRSWFAQLGHRVRASLAGRWDFLTSSPAC